MMKARGSGAAAVVLVSFAGPWRPMGVAARPALRAPSNEGQAAMPSDCMRSALGPEAVPAQSVLMVERATGCARPGTYPLIGR